MALTSNAGCDEQTSGNGYWLLSASIFQPRKKRYEPTRKIA